MPLIQHSDVSITANPARTVLRPFSPAYPDAFAPAEGGRTAVIVQRVAGLSDDALDREVERTLTPLRARHRVADRVLMERFEEIAADLPERSDLAIARKLLVGAYFTEEFAFESVALFNPSIVRHFDQGGVEDGGTRFILSLRGIGEGHLSSVTFRTGSWQADGTVALDDIGREAVGPRTRREEMPNGRLIVHLECGDARTIAENVIYPFMPSQGRGIEDVRFVEFTDGDGRTTYRGTFTAFSGSEVRQGLVQTGDFRSFQARGVEGDLYGSKGMALFPRMIGGRYAMLSRQDNESIWLVYSDDLYKWSGGDKLLGPVHPWEYVQIGNCGSPIEIDEGFLVLTHGVGGARTYCMGAALIDKDDPSRVIGRLTEPLLEPSNARDGYVPNVVYSCGALLRDRTLLLPFAVADSATRFAVVSVDELLTRMARLIGAGARR